MSEKSGAAGKQAEQRQRYLWTATWRAIRAIPIDRFPLTLPAVHPVAAFFILRYLKHRGFSNCVVTTSPTGLVVHAQR
jgi:hypothetical protein